MKEYIQLEYWQLAIAASLILVNGAISLLLRLGMEKRLLVAAFRTTTQLLAVGFVLQAVFELERWYAVLGLMLLMTVVAGIAAVRRSGHVFKGIYASSIASIVSAAWLVTSVALVAVIDVDPWYRPQYAIPLIGMLLGNALNGISLGLDRFTSDLLARRNEVEGLLALGATRWEAARGPIRDAVRTGMIPITNTMMVAGIVSLPGMMTGQLLAGVDPIEAVKYQIVIMFLIAASTALGTVGVVLLSWHRVFTEDHRFEHSMITESGRGR